MFTWLSLVMSLMMSFFFVLFPRDVLDVIWNVIESVFEGFPIYFSFMSLIVLQCRGNGPLTIIRLLN